MLQRYVANAQAFLLVYSQEEPSSWQVLPEYLTLVRQQLNSDSVELPIVVVANKSDAVSDNRVKLDEARAWAEQQRFSHITVCARSPASDLANIFKLLLVREAPVMDQSPKASNMPTQL